MAEGELLRPSGRVGPTMPIAISLDYQPTLPPAMNRLCGRHFGVSDIPSRGSGRTCVRAARAMQHPLMLGRRQGRALRRLRLIPLHSQLHNGSCLNVASSPRAVVEARCFDLSYLGRSTSDIFIVGLVVVPRSDTRGRRSAPLMSSLVCCAEGMSLRFPCCHPTESFAPR